jgi:molybdate transport system regulatory protein
MHQPTSNMLTGHITLETAAGGVLSDSRIRLLEAIDRIGSLNRAAGEVPLSYKAAWDALESMNRLAPEPLVQRSAGGSGGGGTRLTDYGRRLVALYRALELAQQDLLARLPAELPATTDVVALRTLLRRLTLRSSARNQWPGRITALAERDGLIDVTLAPAGCATLRLVATITPESMNAMELRPGAEVWALLKAPAVRIGPVESDALSSTPPSAPILNHFTATLTALWPGPQRCALSLAITPDGLPIHATAAGNPATTLLCGDTLSLSFGSDQLILVRFDV